jgi:hypothetical protein
MTDKCEKRVGKHLESRLEDLRLLWAAYTNAGWKCPECEGEEGLDCELCGGEGTIDEEGYLPDLGNMYEYGLCFDYVAPDTFNDQEEGFFRYQLSTGGPGDEFRIFAQKVNDYRFSVYRIEYWFLDWFDGASRTLYGPDRELLEEIFDSFFVDSGTANVRLEEAMDW